MKSDLILLFGSQLNWFAGLSGKHRIYVLYFILSFILLFTTVNGNWAFLLCAALNFVVSTRLIKQVPIDKLED